jgi:diguanylate cyclase (GGDEF)-like protein
MPAASTHRPLHRRSRWLVASLCLLSSLAAAQAQGPLGQRLAELREVTRYRPDRAVPMLQAIEAQARSGSVADKSEFLLQMCSAKQGIGKLDEAEAACDELIAFGRAAKSDGALARGMLYKSYVMFARGNGTDAHRLIWDAEAIAKRTTDAELRVRTTVSSGQSFAEEGNFPRAVEKLQQAASLARLEADPMLIVIALNALAEQYLTMHEYDKGIAILDEAIAAAREMNSPGRLATLKTTEYRLASSSGQLRRAHEALLAGLGAARKIGATEMIASQLGNLSDSYLKLKQYDDAIATAKQAYDAGRALNNQWMMAVARMNLGEGLIAKGQLAEGKAFVEEALAIVEKSGDKPNLQMALLEYGGALEAAGDHRGAVAAYHRERTLSDELFQKSKQKAVLELQAKYEADRKQQQIELLRRENKIKSAELDNRRLQQRVWWLLAVVFALSSVIVSFLYRKVRSANAQLEEKNLELKQQSVRDPLTGLYNRRHFQEYMRAYQQNEKRGAGTSGEELVGALFLLDVDHFKNINDTSGHAAGDAVLKEISDSLRDILRETDMIVRWGGEEFLAFLPAIPMSGLDDVARRLLTGISTKVIDHQGKPLSANVSIGYAPYPLAPGGEPLSWERAVNLVDMALYLAKGHGRNRAYGVRSFANFEKTTMEAVEQDLERAWREGYVDLSIVLGGTWPELRAAV